MSDDRRQHSRTPKRSWYRVVLLDIDLQPSVELATAGLDISKGGVGAIFAEPIAQGTLLAVQSFSLDGVGPCYLCEVRSCETIYGGWNRVGMVYREMPHGLVERVEAFRDPGSPDRAAA